MLPLCKLKGIGCLLLAWHYRLRPGQRNKHRLALHPEGHQVPHTLNHPDLHTTDHQALRTRDRQDLHTLGHRGPRSKRHPESLDSPPLPHLLDSPVYSRIRIWQPPALGLLMTLEFSFGVPNFFELDKPNAN
jgi:hypothetical protein